jgi:hypothetical protein
MAILEKSTTTQEGAVALAWSAGTGDCRIRCMGPEGGKLKLS